METISFKIETELEFQRVSNAFEENRIPFVAKTNADSSFPALDQAKSFAEISVEANFQNDVKKIVKEILGDQVTFVINSTRKPKSNIVVMALVTYSILVTVFLIKFWNIAANNNDKNFEYEWSWDNTQLSLINKKSGNRGNVYTDLNYDLNFEEIRTFSDRGLLVTNHTIKMKMGGMNFFSTTI